MEFSMPLNCAMGEAQFMGTQVSLQIHLQKAP